MVFLIPTLPFVICKEEEEDYLECQENHFRNFWFWFRMYYEITLSSLQGFLVSVLYCFACSDVQEEVKRIISRKQLNYRLSSYRPSVKRPSWIDESTSRQTRLGSVSANGATAFKHPSHSVSLGSHNANGRPTSGMNHYQNVALSYQSRMGHPRRGSVSTVTTALTCESGTSAAPSESRGDRASNSNTDGQTVDDYEFRRRGSCFSARISAFVSNPEFLRKSVYCKCMGCGETNLRAGGEYSRGRDKAVNWQCLCIHLHVHVCTCA